MGRNPATGEAIEDQSQQESRLPGVQGIERSNLTRSGIDLTLLGAMLGIVCP